MNPGRETAHIFNASLSKYIHVCIGGGAPLGNDVNGWWGTQILKVNTKKKASFQEGMPLAQNKRPLNLCTIPCPETHLVKKQKGVMYFYLILLNREQNFAKKFNLMLFWTACNMSDMVLKSRMTNILNSISKGRTKIYIFLAKNLDLIPASRSLKGLCIPKSNQCKGRVIRTMPR